MTKKISNQTPIEEPRFTLAELELQLKTKEADRQARFARFSELLSAASAETNCNLAVDGTSSLKEPRIIIVDITQ